MPCDSVVVGEFVSPEPSAEITSVNFTGGQNTGSLEFTAKNKSDLKIYADVEVTVMDANTLEQLASKMDHFVLGPGKEFQFPPVEFDFSFNSETDVKVCADVTNVGEF